MNKKILKLKKIIEDAQQKIDEIILDCSHFGVTATSHSNQEYGCGTEYWYRLTCTNCGHIFTVDQDRRRFISGQHVVFNENKQHTIKEFK